VRRRLLVLIMLTLLATACAPAAPADAASSSRRVCVAQAVLRDAPRGFIVAYLRRGTPVRYLRRTADRRHTAVRTRQGRIGWVVSGALCRA
jgi:hypothetical protein